jgi:1,4-alpha-glucan branching enzyme
MSDIMVKTSKYDDKDPTLIRILNQMAKELLLAQASDWAFIMTTGTTVEYAVKRTKEHINRFFELFYMFDNKIDEKRLKEIEWLDKIFDDLDYKIFRNNC